MSTGLRISAYAVLVCGYLALVTTQRYSGVILSLPVVLILLAPAAEWLDGRFALYGRLTGWFNLVYLLLIPAFYSWFGLLGTVILLVIYVQVYTMLHRKERRNYYYLFLMSFFLLLAACVLSPEPEIGLVMLVFLLSAIGAFMFLQLRVELEENRGGSPPDIVSLEEKGVVLFAPPPRIIDAGLAAVMLVVASGGVLITAGLFLITPRMEAGLLGRTDPTLFTTGISQDIDLAAGGRIVQDYAAVMRVEFPGEPGGRYDAPLFWRCTSLNEYHDARWARQGLTTFPKALGFAVHPRYLTGAHDVIRRPPFGAHRLVQQAIYMDDVPVEGVPALPFVQKAKRIGGSRGALLSWDIGGDFTLMLAGSGQRRLQYEAWSEVGAFTPARLRSAPDNYRDVLPPSDYALLTYHDLLPATQRRVRGITARQDTVYDKAQAIAAYLNRGAYSYALDLPNLPRDHSVDAFLNETKIGHCELFASAMALMLRSLGIPTRVVSGYRGGEWQSADASYTVRASMAHLWVEVYFINVGWVTFDPSPADTQLAGFGHGRLARAASWYVLKAKMVWYRDVIAFDRGIQLQRLRDVSLGLVGMGSSLLDRSKDAPAGRRPGGGFVAPIGAVTVVGGALLLFVRRRALRAKKPLLTADQARAVRVYGRLRRRLGRLGVDLRGKTAEELSGDILQHEAKWENGEAALEVLAAYNDVRFGARPLSSERYGKLRKAVRSLRRLKNRG